MRGQGQRLIRRGSGGPRTHATPARAPAPRLRLRVRDAHGRRSGQERMSTVRKNGRPPSLQTFTGSRLGGRVPGAETRRVPGQTRLFRLTPLDFAGEEGLGELVGIVRVDPDAAPLSSLGRGQSGFRRSVMWTSSQCVRVTFFACAPIGGLPCRDMSGPLPPCRFPDPGSRAPHGRGGRRSSRSVVSRPEGAALGA